MEENRDKKTGLICIEDMTEDELMELLKKRVQASKEGKTYTQEEFEAILKQEFGI
ncbi:MAG: hypothetical protein LUD51_06540 [Clostridia bacterium]|nr:hypothetical protein [Clostridia bacterium]